MTTRRLILALAALAAPASCAPRSRSRATASPQWPAIRIARRYAKTTITIGLATLREDGRFWSEPGDWSKTVLLRR